MKLISLNVWGGKLFDDLMAFIRNEKGTTDVFCFQEVFWTQSGIKELRGFQANLYQEIAAELTDFTGLYDKVVLGRDIQGDSVDFPVWYGLAIFVKKSLPIIEHGSIPIFTPNPTEDGEGHFRRTLQYAVVGQERYIIANVHGLHLGGGKEDLPQRIRQSNLIHDFLSKRLGKKILCGDFNLLPETESLKILEQGMMNLITVHHIETTRSKFYTKPAKFADYTFVSPDVQVKSFTVPNVEASDHLPMIVEFE